MVKNNVSTPTRKKKVNPVSSPSTTKKKLVWGSPGVVSSAMVPYNKTKVQNIDLVKTRVNGLYIGISTKSWAPGESSFLFELEKALNDSSANGSKLAEEWRYVFGFFPRRQWDPNVTDDPDLAYSDFDSMNVTMKSKEGSKWDWKVFCVWIQDPKTIDNAGKHIANSFTKFLKNKYPSDSAEKFTYRHCFSDDPKSLNYHLLDLDVAKILRHIVRHNEDAYDFTVGTSKQELMEDEDLMTAFFKDYKYGKEYLAQMDDMDWENL